MGSDLYLFGLKRKNNKTENPYWHKDYVNNPEHSGRIAQVLSIKKYLLREHKVLTRPDFYHKDEVFISAKNVLNIIQSVLNSHISYLVGNQISYNGNPDVVSKVNNIYKRGNYAKVDYEIVKDLYTFGNAFEYVYLDSLDNRIKSKVIANEDAIPIYDDNGNYVCFVERWKNNLSSDEHCIVYYSARVETYVNDRLIETRLNVSGLPIHYSGVNKSRYKQFGEPMINDLIPIVDAVENIISRLDDAVHVYGMNPLGVVTGKTIKSSIPKEVIGEILNLDDGNDFKFATAMQDYQSIKLELDTLWQQFYAIACLPASHMGQLNINNVSETSLRLLFSKADDKAKETMIPLKDGLFKRCDCFRKLLALSNVRFSDDDFDTLDLNFNPNRPVDTYSLLEEMYIQYQMGAISKQTIIDRSPYTVDTVAEMERLKAEQSTESRERSTVQGLPVRKDRTVNNSEDEALN